MTLTKRQREVLERMKGHVVMRSHGVMFYWPGSMIRAPLPSTMRALFRLGYAVMLSDGRCLITDAGRMALEETKTA